MPELTRFLGIVISMLYNDHAPPHFHASYGNYRISLEIKTGTVEGKFPKRALKLVLEWYELYKGELLQEWDKAQNHEPLDKLPPLE
jgi:hypothetical protein